MNYKAVFGVIGELLMMLGVLMLLPIGVAILLWGAWVGHDIWGDSDLHMPRRSSSLGCPQAWMMGIAFN
ncbi:hypothetical protein DRN85_00830 [Methanosarcinales archaeon]|nr:MAG: hypothetical protein DRN85_00830 [Methanosarcinales archaeon]